MNEYNLFTQKLFAQGYTFEHYPDYAKLPHHGCDKHLFEILGGFEYKRHYLYNKVYATGCGLLCKGSEFSNGYMSFAGIDWKPENDNPVVCCPYRVNHCPLRHPLLDCAKKGGLCQISQCNCHEVKHSYDYDHSIQKVRDEQEHIIRQKYEVFRQQRKNHICYWHMRYNYRTKEWRQLYNPIECARNCQNIGGICDLKHSPISKKRGNVFYDLKITKIRRDDTLFNGQEEISIRKGCRFLETNTSLTICENIVRYSSAEIQKWEEGNFHSERFLFGWKVEVQNIRAEYRESRDLLQDLQDIHNGITVIHASDQIKQNKESKRLRRINQKEKREQQLEKKIVQEGWDSIAPYSLDYIHAIKWFGEEKIQDLENRHQEYLRAQQNQPQQLSLFELL